ncbi:MAG: hypothetical protein J5585_11000 [Clostridia bacterium]|nr:hypothetical protein [Clostridia bacterium]
MKLIRALAINIVFITVFMGMTAHVAALSDGSNDPSEELLAEQSTVMTSISSDPSSATYWIKDATANRYLTKSINSTVIPLPFAAANTPKWQFVETTVSSSTYYCIVNAETFSSPISGDRYAVSYDTSSSTGISLSVLSHDPSTWTNYQKWSLILTDVVNNYYKIQCSNGLYLKMTSTAVTYTIFSNEATVFEFVRASNTFTPYSDMNGYIMKVNSSELIEKMNCYGYAIRAYINELPFLVGQDFDNDYIIDTAYWASYKLQMGDISGEDSYRQFLNNYANINHNNLGGYYYTDIQMTYLTAAVIYSVNCDLQQIYGYANNVVYCSNNSSDIPLGDWRKVALVMTQNWTDEYPFDYHWYVENDDGTWSHKPGISTVRNSDDSYIIITDPETANTGNYDYFAGYYYIRCDNVIKEVTFDNNNTATVTNDGSGDILYHSKTLGEIYPSRTLTADFDYCNSLSYKLLGRIIGLKRYLYVYVRDNYDNHFIKYPKYADLMTNPIQYGYDPPGIQDIGYYSSIQNLESAEIGYITVNNSQYPISSDSYGIAQDVDFYEFTVYSPGDYEIYTEYYSTGEEIDTFGKLYQGNTLLYSDQDSGYDKNFKIEATLSANTVYRISVTGGKTGQSGRYVLNIIKK